MRFLFLFTLLLTLTLPALAQNYDCEVISYDTHITYSGRTVTTHLSYTLQINSPKGTNYAEISIPYQEDTPLKNLNAHIETLDGTIIRKLKNKDIEHTSAYSNVSFHSDQKQAAFKLIHNQYPYRLKYSFTRQEDAYISLANWNAALFQKAPVRQATLKVEVPKQTELHIHERNIDPAHIQEGAETTIYSWRSENAIRPPQESHAPSIHHLCPTVQVTPHQFHYSLTGHSQSWMTYGNWVEQLNQGLDMLTEEDRNKVHQLTDHLTNEDEKIRALYHYLQDNTRYINVSMDFGGLCPYPASYVGKNKYGDCKALTNYLKALLREAGIYSIYTDVYAGDYPKPIYPEIPSQQFNHVILCVPQAQDTIWLECTSSTSPYNYLGSFTQNKPVLLIEKDNSRLIQTPALTTADVAEYYHHQVAIDAEGNATFITNANVRGPQFELLKGLDTYAPASRKTEIMDWLRLIKGADITNYEITNPHRDSTYLDLQLQGSIHHLMEKMGHKALLKPVNTFHLNLEKPAERTQAVCIPYPIVKTDTVALTLPWAISELAGLTESTFDSPYGSYQRHYYIDQNQLTVVRQVSLYAGHYPITEYEAFYEFIRNVSRQEQQKTLITYN